MKVLQIFLLSVVAVAAFSEELVSVDETFDIATHESSSPLLTLIKKRINFFKNQFQTCRVMLERCKHKMFIDCKDAYNKGFRKNGVYTLKPDKGKQFNAYCDMTKGGYTVFQRRKDGSVSFYRSWNQYQRGFGNLKGDHWLGLEKIYRLSRVSRSFLRVDISDHYRRTAYAIYRDFSIGSFATRYRLNVAGYSGTAGNGLAYHNGKRFSTYDQDHDSWSSNCAGRFKGGWWYNACYHVNLNGYFSRNYLLNYQYMMWYPWRRRWTPVKTSQMSMRRY